MFSRELFRDPVFQIALKGTYAGDVHVSTFRQNQIPSFLNSALTCK